MDCTDDSTVHSLVIAVLRQQVQYTILKKNNVVIHHCTLHITHAVSIVILYSATKGRFLLNASSPSMVVSRTKMDTHRRPHAGSLVGTASPPYNGGVPQQLKSAELDQKPVPTTYNVFKSHNLRPEDNAHDFDH